MAEFHDIIMMMPGLFSAAASQISLAWMPDLVAQLWSTAGSKKKWSVDASQYSTVIPVNPFGNVACDAAMCNLHCTGIWGMATCFFGNLKSSSRLEKIKIEIN